MRIFLRMQKKIGYTFYPNTMKKIERVHRLFMPIVENMITNMLKETEGESPDYYVLARDGELLYDALWGISQAGEKHLSNRIHFLKTSQGMRFKKVNPKYFHSIGITEERFKTRGPVIFLDSGFQGSLFYDVMKWAGCSHKISSENMQGYLIRSNGSFSQMEHSGNINMNKIEEAMRDSPYCDNIGGSANGSLCAFMQLMPKFTGRYVQTFQRDSGKWDVMPEKSPIASRLNMFSNEECVDTSAKGNYSIEDICGWVNSDVVDPVASLILQKRTLKYFTDLNVQDRVYSKI